jgi:hypothetical protein
MPTAIGAEAVTVADAAEVVSQLPPDEVTGVAENVSDPDP